MTKAKQKPDELTLDECIKLAKMVPAEAWQKTFRKEEYPRPNSEAYLASYESFRIKVSGYPSYGDSYVEVYSQGSCMTGWYSESNSRLENKLDKLNRFIKEKHENYQFARRHNQLKTIEGQERISEVARARALLRRGK